MNNQKPQKKVLVIHSSRRKKNTWNLLQDIRHRLEEEGITTEVLSLHDHLIRSCTGCERCIRGFECALKDDMATLMKTITEYDGIVLSSPVYMGCITGTLKTFIDRTSAWYHRPEMVGKPILSVSTTMGSRLKETLNFLEYTGIQWGMMPSGRIGRNVVTMNTPVRKLELGRFLKNLYAPLKSHRPTLRMLEFFSVQKVLALKILDNDRQFWRQKGWDRLYYYYRCRPGIIARLYSALIYLILDKVIRRVDGAENDWQD